MIVEWHVVDFERSRNFHNRIK